MPESQCAISLSRVHLESSRIVSSSQPAPGAPGVPRGPREWELRGGACAGLVPGRGDCDPRVFLTWGPLATRAGLCGPESPARGGTTWPGGGGPVPRLPPGRGPASHTPRAGPARPLGRPRPRPAHPAAARAAASSRVEGRRCLPAAMEGDPREENSQCPRPPDPGPPGSQGRTPALTHPALHAPTLDTPCPPPYFPLPTAPQAGQLGSPPSWETGGKPNVLALRGLPEAMESPFLSPGKLLCALLCETGLHFRGELLGVKLPNLGQALLSLTRHHQMGFGPRMGPSCPTSKAAVGIVAVTLRTRWVYMSTSVWLPG